MSTPPEKTQIRIEDFKSEDQELAQKFATVINKFTDQTINLFTKNIDYDNLNRQLVTVQIQLDGGGVIINNPQVKYSLRDGRVRGAIVVGATNISSPGTYPTNTPFISFTFSNGLLTIVNVTGLQNSSTYSLVIELIG